MDRIAIVILNWNGQKMMSQYLHTVIQYSMDKAVIYVADNASTDNSVEWLKENFPQVQIIILDKNYGFADGYNRALRQISSEYYVLLNSDIEVTPDWLNPLIEYMDSHDDVAVCQPKLLSVMHKNQFEYAGAAGGYLDRFGYPFCRGRIFETIEEDRGQYDSQTNLLWATGACLMIRSADYWRVGGLDARFFAHNEEIDLCWRLRIVGRRIVYLPFSKVYHVGGGTLPKGNPMKTFLNFRNNLTMLYKNLPEKDLRYVMRWRMFLDYVAAFKMLILEFSIKDFMAVIKARRAFRQWLPEFHKDRIRIQQQRKEMVDDERKMFSLLWQYYIRGKKHFTDLP